MRTPGAGRRWISFSLPAPRWFEEDGGRYLGTADTVVTRDPDSPWVNVATYRVMIHDRNTLGIFMEASRHGRLQMQKYFERGQPCPVAISFGHHPSLFLLAGTEVPQGLSEYHVAGAMLGEPYAAVKGPVTGLPLPADSEIAIEGHIVDEPRDEGPFGEFMGYYAGGRSPAPTIKVEALYHRNRPVLLGTCAGRPPYDYSYFRCPMRAALIWDILERAGIANVAGVWCHEQGYSRAFTVVALKQAFAGHARQAGYVACQCRPGAVSGRYVVVVDEDIDPTNLDEVVWAMCSRSDPATGLEIVRETLGTPIDPIAERRDDKSILEYTSSRAIVLACKPFGMLVRNEFPKVVEAGADLRARVRKEFLDLFK
ncbi:MAG: UbiD family decarboxylase [Planctomycetota bacterium]|nr:UbiD family decarboxylase [Planctomycetota bacterium]